MLTSAAVYFSAAYLQAFHHCLIFEDPGGTRTRTTSSSAIMDSLWDLITLLRHPLENGLYISTQETYPFIFPVISGITANGSLRCLHPNGHIKWRRVTKPHLKRPK
jgi:hypothetical protein